MCLSNILGESEIDTIPKTWEGGFPQYGKNIGKRKHFKFVGFLNISGEAEIDKISKIWEK